MDSVGSQGRGVNSRGFWIDVEVGLRPLPPLVALRGLGGNEDSAAGVHLQ